MGESTNYWSVARQFGGEKTLSQLCSQKKVIE
jgi:hypothetical protein